MYRENVETFQYGDICTVFVFALPLLAQPPPVTTLDPPVETALFEP